jgi:hypothetical protein
MKSKIQQIFSGEPQIESQISLERDDEGKLVHKVMSESFSNRVSRLISKQKVTSDIGRPIQVWYKGEWQHLHGIDPETKRVAITFGGEQALKGRNTLLKLRTLYSDKKFRFEPKT